MKKKAQSREGKLEGPTIHNPENENRFVPNNNHASQPDTSASPNPANPGVSQSTKPDETNLLKILWHLNPDLLAVKDTRGTYQIANPAFFECFGIREEDIIGKTDADLFPGNEGKIFLRSDLEAIRAGEPVSCEEVRQTVNGRRHYYVSRVPYCAPEGHALGLLFCLRDITELKQKIQEAEQATIAIREHGQVLQQLIDSMPAGVMLLDSQLRLLAWNKTYITYFEPSPKWQIGARIQDVMPLAEESGIMERLRRALRTGKPVRVNEFRYEGLRKGTTYWRGVAVPLELTLENGKSAALAVMVVDVTREVMARERYVQFAELANQREKEKAELYEQEHSIAIQLQKSFLLHEMPDVQGFAIARRYQAASGEALIGGDFYDIFRISERKLGIVIGDVSGRGLNAAIYTAMTKHMLRAYALENSSPSLVLSRLNDALISCTPVEIFVTLIYGILDSENGTFTFSNAGHEPPIYFSQACNKTFTIDLRGQALAMIPRGDYAQETVSFAPGDIMVLYTDGISDAGHGTHRLGEESLISAINNYCSLGADDVAEIIMHLALEIVENKPTDDMALLVIKALPSRRKSS
ncbi:MAG: SpoIIE family protein phosphatase [Armatimonadota bacterium]